MIPIRRLSDFYDDVLVQCPACGGRAIVRRTGEAQRLTCTACPKTQESKGPLFMPGLGLPLWLSLETRHGPFWALNAAHLNYLEQIISARIRTERREEGDVRNASVLSRLPLWIKQAKNRDEALKCIAKLRERLGKA